MNLKNYLSLCEAQITKSHTDTKELTFDQTWDAIVDNMIATEDEMRLVCHINGKRKSELDNVVSAKTEYHTIEQYIKFTH